MAPPPTDGPPGAHQRTGTHRVVLLLALLFLVALCSHGPAGLTNTDEAIYAAQARNLASGSWWSERPAPEVDPSGVLDGLVSATVSDDRHLPYSRHPLFPLLLTPFAAIGGLVGILVASALATWGAAVLIGRITYRFDSALELPAMWLAGLGTPLLFDGLLAVGHSAVTAAAAGLVLAVLAARGGSRRALWAVAPLTAVAVLLRTEGVVLAVVLGCAVGMSCLRSRSRTGLLASGLVLATATGAFLTDRAWVRAIAGGGTAASDIERSPDPLATVWHGLLRPWGTQGDRASVVWALVALLVPLAALALRSAKDRPFVPTALLVAAAVLALARHLTPPDLISGLLPAAPVLLTGLVLLGREDLRDDGAILALTAGTAAAAIAASTYGVDAAEWGGRFFHVTLPALVPLAVLGLRRGRDRLGPGAVHLPAAAVLVVVLATASLAIRTNDHYRRESARLVNATMTAADAPELGADPLVAVLSLQQGGASRYFWAEIADGVDVLAPMGIGGFDQFLRSAHEHGRERILVLSSVPFEIVGQYVSPTLDELGLEMQTITDADGNRFGMITPR